MMRVYGFKALVLWVCLGLVGCLGLGDKEAPKLQGPRLDVTLQPTILRASKGALAEDFRIPAAQMSENWGQTAANSAHAPGHVALPAKVVRAWSAKVGGAGRGVLLNAPVVHSGRVFVLNGKADIVALDAKNGKELWQVRLPLLEAEQASLTGGLAVIGNLLLATTADGQVFALTASSGKQVWTTNLAVPLRAAPTVEGERVYVTSHDNRLFVLNALDGALLWTHSGMEESLSLLASSSPAAANGLVAVPYSSGEIYVLRASDGRYAWHDTLASPFSGQDPESTITAITAPPVIADGLLYAVGVNGGLSAYALTTGQRFWKADIVTSQLPIVVGYQIFALTDGGDLVGMNRTDGRIRWVMNLNTEMPDVDEARTWAGPILAGGRLIAVSSDGLAVSVDPQTGKRLAATDLGEAVSLAPVVAEGALIFLTDEGRVIVFLGEK